MTSLLRSIRSTCSSSSSTATATSSSPPLPKHLFSDTSSISDTATSSSHDSLLSNLSLQTLPSVPSLQTLIPKAATSAHCHVIHLSLHSLSSPKPAPISALAVRRHFLYAAFAHEVHVIDTNNMSNINISQENIDPNYQTVDVFNRDGSKYGSVKSIAFSDGKVVTAHQDGRIRVWRIGVAKRHRLFATLPTQKDYLRHFIFPQNYVKIRRHKKGLWVEHHDAVSGLATTTTNNNDNNSNLLFSVSWDRNLKVWGSSDFRCLESLRIHDDAINAIVAGSDGSIYTASADRRIKVWGRPIGEKNSDFFKHVLIATLEKHKSAVNALALNSDGTILFSGACDRSILVWEREDSANHMVVSGALRGHSRAILCLINVSDLLFSGSADRTVRIWQRGCDGRYCCLSVLDGHDRPVKALVAIKEDESDGCNSLKVFSGSFDGEIKVWRVEVPNLNENMLYSNFSNLVTKSRNIRNNISDAE